MNRAIRSSTPACTGCTREYRYSASGTSVGASLLRPDDAGQSVCFNNCSGHGRCIDYTCECDAGYDGDDCSFCYIDGGDTVLPILSVGDVNLTSSNFRKTLHDAGSLLVVATSPSCHRCIHLETEYQSASAELQGKGVRFGPASSTNASGTFQQTIVLGRVNADAELALLGRILGGVEAAAQHLPVILLWTETRKSRKALLYDGAHERHAIVEYVRKQLEPPAKSLATITAVENFVKGPQFGALGTAPSEAVTARRSDDSYILSNSVRNLGCSPNRSKIVGFFSGAGEMEENELEDFMEAATDLKPRSDVYFGFVDDEVVCGHFKKLGWIQRASEAVLTRPGLSRAPSLTLWAILEDNLSIQDWVVRGEMRPTRCMNRSFMRLMQPVFGCLQESLPLVGRLSNANFAQYERTHLPMLIMFLELPGSRERLPQVGFNTMDGRQIPFPEDLPINRETLLHFAAAFLSGRLQSALDARKAMVVSRPFSAHNTVRRKDRRGTPTEVRGVSEQLKPKDAITQTTGKVRLRAQGSHRSWRGVDKKQLETFASGHSITQSCLLVLLLVIQRVGERFLDLDIPSVLIAAMDVTLETPPPEVAMTLPPLPAIVLLPGDDKEAPFSPPERFLPGRSPDITPPLPFSSPRVPNDYRFFSGVGKVGPLMRWLQEHSSTPFELPALPHLSEEDKPLFRKQVRERQHLLNARASQES
ncbi:unnamed protein product [Ectocarpus sp. CCAP 1310/34]|nr:unnamed protein product [Ectocarpus sp. CCAP 1310/34]